MNNGSVDDSTPDLDGSDTEPESRTRRLLFVCEGNVCRSPYAEVVTAQRLAAAGVHDIEVRSAGLRGLEGSTMDELMARHAIEVGANPRDHRGRRVDVDALERATVVLVASRAIRSEIVRMLPAARRYTFTLGEMARILSRETATPPECAPGSVERVDEVLKVLENGRGLRKGERIDGDDIVDPIGRTRAVHARAAGQLNAALNPLLDRLGAERLPTVRVPWRDRLWSALVESDAANVIAGVSRR